MNPEHPPNASQPFTTSDAASLISPIPPPRRKTTLGKAIMRAVVEIAFIIFLFYSNLLMSEFTVADSRGKTLAFALRDIVTPTNFAIACISALVGYLVFEHLRARL